MAGAVPWRRLCHWGPWLVLSALVLCGVITLCATLLWAWPVHLGGSGGGVHLGFLLLWVPTLLSPYLHAVFVGPGFVPAGWRPERFEETRLLPYCEKCRSFKPLRAHHCRQCQRCVLKMDHHCPWINACVGLRNHASFVAFLLLTPIAGFHSLALLGSTLYQEFLGPVFFFVPAADGANSTLAVEATSRYPFGVLALVNTLASFVVTLTAIPFLVLLGVRQLNGLLRNRTYIEGKIEAKAAERFASGRRERPFRFPFDLGSAWRNLQQELPPTRLRVDGLRWPTAPGADPYCVNEEHAAQKEERTLSCVRYRVLEAYAGATCPLAEGPVVCLAAPFTGEPRLALAPGDTVVVNKNMPHWMYGEKISRAGSEGELAPQRGWFPQRYVDLLDSVHSSNHSEAGETELLNWPGGNAGSGLIGFAHSFQAANHGTLCLMPLPEHPLGFTSSFAHRKKII